MNASRALHPLGALLRGLARIFGFGRRVGTGAKSTISKSSASKAAQKLSSISTRDDNHKGGKNDGQPKGFESFLFKQLQRPKLTERSASDLTVEQAKKFAKYSEQFYGYEFPLFTKGEMFYEEVENEFIQRSLGNGEDSTDERFLDEMGLFRRTINENSCSMLMMWTPIIFLGSMIAGLYAVSAGIGAQFFKSAHITDVFTINSLTLAATMLIGIVLIYFIYSWPYKVVQQRNLMNLDNYLTSKFARINHNFQVAKRRALNVERDKRMGQADDLKEEAGAWTLSYHWFATRLFLCELSVRNKFYQVRRNTTLYWGGGTALTLIGLAAIVGLFVFAQVNMNIVVPVILVGGGALLLAFSFLRNVSSMLFRVIEANEWSRYHLINLNGTIADHVGEDKVQIVTFRDRNRME